MSSVARPEGWGFLVVDISGCPTSMVLSAVLMVQVDMH